MGRYISILRRGGVVACATETLFGLLADALNPQAVDRVVKLKQRNSGQPIAVLIPTMAEVFQVVEEVPEVGYQLIKRFWPGPLTLVLKARRGLPLPLVHSGKVGVRIPGPSDALEITRAYGAPLTATSANLSGEPGPMTAHQVYRSLGAGPDAIVDGCAKGRLPSTVVDVTQSPIQIIRRGAVDIGMIR